jgi:hypothetical protein
MYIGIKVVIGALVIAIIVGIVGIILRKKRSYEEESNLFAWICYPLLFLSMFSPLLFSVTNIQEGEQVVAGFIVMVAFFLSFGVSMLVVSIARVRPSSSVP